MTTPFSLRIFVADGDPDGLRIVERFNASARAVVFPRALLPQVKVRPELQQTGVYLLLGPRPDGEGELLYVGEGDPILPRLQDHQSKKDFWTRAIGFVAVGGLLNKAHVQFLEARLIALARAAKRVPLDNGNFPGEPTLSEADRADMEVFLAHMLGMLPVLGVHAFESAPGAVVSGLTATGPASAAPTLLYCKGKGVEATGYESTQGFVVCKGSQAVADVVPSLETNKPARLVQREDLIDRGVVERQAGAFRFTQDYVFSSPSLASTFVLGMSSNGRTKWRDAHGRTLKELQEAEAGS
ncbi:GIY-YIG nuclease family protein [Hydrogenophaga sp.]|uniref:GIY-YIG nuclease family protein n=1 Tax=Hydrogenophaga sp. TaxID=1904254 RepID=UPI0008C00FCE|nr:GIY-YIG nuclease family protein [Hydrogenophaga sp.]OGA77847.1 MAG: peptide methionine sulfoxide reductase [Burkholderiales bacterium GWE1_65_30]OGA94197.1 MAG: peptide methionine sulfoxide reductase [Burkholderiales bacterium GWF1_66_17]